jgi:S1-C subfamily serine protease
MHVLILLLLCLPCFAEGVRIKAERNLNNSLAVSYGTGVFIEKKKLLTAWHVLDSGGEVYAEVDGNWLKCKVLKHNEELDLALLECKGEGHALKLAKADPLTVFGSDESKPVTEKKVSGFSSMVKGAVKNGNSGGPVVNSKGELVGIVIARNPEGNKGVFVALDSIREFLEE